MPHKDRWTKDDDNHLIFNWSIKHIGTIAKKLGRTVSAVESRAQLLKLGGVFKSGYTMSAVVRKTGYCERAVRTMAERLNIKLRKGRIGNSRTKRSTKKRWYNITQEQMDSIIEGFNAIPEKNRIEKTIKGEWGSGGLNYKKPDSCLKCKNTKHKHEARGLCTPCYSWAKRHSCLDTYPTTRHHTSVVHEYSFGCLLCNDAEIRTYGRGLCHNCYFKVSRRKELQKYPTIKQRK